MNPFLYEALEKLQKSGADKLPRPETVEAANDGKIWSGKKANGELWILTKENEDSYKVQC